VRHVGDIGVFKIVSEGGVAAAVRRIEAVTGEGALAWFADQQRRLDEASELLGASRRRGRPKSCGRWLDRQRRLERELEGFKAKAAAGKDRVAGPTTPRTSIGVKGRSPRDGRPGRQGSCAMPSTIEVDARRRW
jgi:alanyl-tRNA synthetase